jgi:hypothetical protein
MLAALKVGEVEVVPAEFDPRDCEATGAWWWEGKRLHLRVRRDEAQGGYFRQVLHELIHAHLHDPLLKIVAGELHEAALRGVEDACVKHAEKHRGVYERWRVAIATKMEAS